MGWLLSLLSVIALAGVALFFAFTEYLDWRGRMEVIERQHPKLWEFVNARSFRLVLLVLIFAMLAENARERLRDGRVEPLVVKVNAVPSPDPGAKNAEIARLQRELELASLRSSPGAGRERLIASGPSRIFNVEAPSPGDFTVKHGAGCKPSLVFPVMTTGGNFWFQTPVQYDNKNVYFVASDKGITARVLVWCER